MRDRLIEMIVDAENEIANLKQQFDYLYEMYLYQKEKNEKAVNGDGETDL